MNLTQAKYKPINIPINITKRLLVVLIASLSILLTAGSCSFPGITPTANVSLGLLKKDPSIKNDGFGRINTVQTRDGQKINTGLATLSGLKLQQIDSDKFIYVTKQKGLFLSEDGGRVWVRKYIFPVDSTDSDQNKRDQEIKNEIAINDALLISDVVVDPTNPANWFVSTKKDKVGKIYATTDNGNSFREIYSEVEDNIGVLYMAINTNDAKNIFAVLEKGALIGTTDGGNTWQKIRSFKDTPVQLGFVKELGNQFFVLFQNQGLFSSNDGGKNWENRLLTKSQSNIGENQPKDGLESSLKSNATFGKYEKMVPVTSPENAGWVLVADRQIWVSPSLDSAFEKIVLPLQSEQFNVLDVETDPAKGLNKIYTSVDDRLFVSENRGQSWATGDQIQLPTPIGNIGQIVVDKNNPDIMYLLLVDKNAQRGSGVFGGF